MCRGEWCERGAVCRGTGGVVCGGEWCVKGSGVEGSGVRGEWCVEGLVEW